MRDHDPNDYDTISLFSHANALNLAGAGDANLKLLAQRTQTQLTLRGQDLWVKGDEIQRAQVRQLVGLLQPLWQQGTAVVPVDIETAFHALKSQRTADDYRQSQAIVLAHNRRGQAIRPKTARQHRYVQAIANHELTFGVGPAGTGKTYLAAVMAMQALQDQTCERLVLTRPAMEAGERLGFLPGDLQQKVDPYLRPLYDAIYEFIDPAKCAKLMEDGTIEVAPLAYMRGRTLSHSFVILDEAQNTTPEQMKMVLTRLGYRSRMVITGDLSQTDLGPHRASGLAIANRVLRDVEGIAFCTFDQQDVVRHPLVQRIVAAYERHEPPAHMD